VTTAASSTTFTAGAAPPTLTISSLLVIVSSILDHSEAPTAREAAKVDGKFWKSVRSPRGT
jgi:hypothetical protein